MRQQRTIAARCLESKQLYNLMCTTAAVSVPPGVLSDLLGVVWLCTPPNPPFRAARGTLSGANRMLGPLSITCVTVLLLTGGAAHSFEVGGYKFDAGPSFFLGIDGEIGASSPNPLKQVGRWALGGGRWGEIAVQQLRRVGRVA